MMCRNDWINLRIFIWWVLSILIKKQKSMCPDPTFRLRYCLCIQVNCMYLFTFFILCVPLILLWPVRTISWPIRCVLILHFFPSYVSHSSLWPVCTILWPVWCVPILHLDWHWDWDTVLSLSLRWMSIWITLEFPISNWYLIIWRFINVFCMYFTTWKVTCTILYFLI